MSRAKVALLCLPLALAGVGLAIHASYRIAGGKQELQSLALAASAEGRSFEDTLRGEHAERQRLAFDRRRALVLELAAARRDQLLGVVLTLASGLAYAGLSILARISAEVEEDRRHVAESGAGARRHN
ncbi:MAG: hypothetical protein QM767_08225 [Anaeromyxobacter sp.]